MGAGGGVVVLALLGVALLLPGPAAAFSLRFAESLSSFVFSSKLSCQLSKQHGCRQEIEALRAWHAALPKGPVAQESDLQGKGGSFVPDQASTATGRRRLQEGSEPRAKLVAEVAGAGTVYQEGTTLEGTWKPDKTVARDFAAMSVAEMQGIIKEQEEEMARVKEMTEDLKAELRRLTEIKSKQDFNITILRPDFSSALLTPKLMEEARGLIAQCSGNGVILSKPSPTWKGYACNADDEAVARYLSYPDRGPCPDDWPSTQKMIFVESCFALPKRRCLNPTAPSWKEPMPFPQSLFDQDALIDENVRWTQHGCKSFECLNARLIGDCRNCFSMPLEARRWRRAYRGSLPMREVIALKNGSLRIGLDAGGGSGSFAAHMARYGVTIMTTAMNIETIKGRDSGLPYMETIALRGLIPLHVPHKSRLPFFDNTLDVIHCVNSVKYLPMLEFEELLFEWDRVLRVGGVLWFEMFYAPMDEMPVYVALIEQLGYKKLHWNMMPKPDYGERVGLHIYLNCIIEKPVRSEPTHRRGWFG